MAKLIRFENSMGQQIFVAPEQVKAVQPHMGDQWVNISFGAEHSVVVQGPIEDVVRQIADA